MAIHSFFIESSQKFNLSMCFFFFVIVVVVVDVLDPYNLSVFRQLNHFKRNKQMVTHTPKHGNYDSTHITEHIRCIPIS